MDDDTNTVRRQRPREQRHVNSLRELEPAYVQLYTSTPGGSTSSCPASGVSLTVSMPQVPRSRIGSTVPNDRRSAAAHRDPRKQPRSRTQGHSLDRQAMDAAVGEHQASSRVLSRTDIFAC